MMESWNSYISYELLNVSSAFLTNINHMNIRHSFNTVKLLELTKIFINRRFIQDQAIIAVIIAV